MSTVDQRNWWLQVVGYYTAVIKNKEALSTDLEQAPRLSEKSKGAGQVSGKLVFCM